MKNNESSRAVWMKLLETNARSPLSNAGKGVDLNEEGNDQKSNALNDKQANSVSVEPTLNGHNVAEPNPDVARILAPSLIEVIGAGKTYRMGSIEVPALKNVTIRVTIGEFVSIIGPSGSGKSTLLNLITGIDKPSYGKVIVAGQAIHKMKENELARWRGRNVGIVFQFHQLLPTLTVIENVMLPMDFCHVYKRGERKQRALHLLEQFGIGGHAYKLPSALSGGEQQRVAIVRALANDPGLVVADEPTGNLDTGTTDEVLSIFEQLVDQGKTIVMVTHDLALSARTHRAIRVLDGQICVGANQDQGMPEVTHA